MNVTMDAQLVEESPTQTRPETTRRLERCFSINQDLLVFKLYYLFTFSAKACLEPFLSVFMRHLGMSAEQTGIIIGIKPVASFLGSLLWGALADRYRKHRTVMLLMCTMSTALFFSLVFFKPQELPATDRSGKCNSSLPMNGSLTGDFRKEIKLNCSCSENCTISDSSALTSWDHSGRTNVDKTAANVNDNTKTFIALICLIFTYAFFANFNLIADAATVKFLTVMNKGREYGNQRVWGAVGWGVVAVVSGFAIDKSASNLEKSQFLPAFCGFLLLNVGTLVATHRLPLQSLKGRSDPKIFQNMQIILTDCNVVTFLIAILVMGICYSTIGIFLFWFLQDMGGSHLLMGLALFMTCVAEVPLMFFSGDLIRLMGHHNMLYLTFACYTVRYLLYSFIPNAWYFLAVEPLHGVTFGAMWATTTSYGGKISPEGMTATVMGLVNATHFGLGQLLAGFGGGRLYSQYGPKVLFRGLAVTSAVTCLLFYASQKLLSKRLQLSYTPCQDVVQEMESASDLGMNEVDMNIQ